ncbi:MAG: transporter substrate-binding domain-containing protein [Pseudomonas sp.]|uniref:substrate-binding periplasmic protein n=1 Tax=Pseudomonas sp. TaxID=306 RepID=UPI003396D2B3
MRKHGLLAGVLLMTGIGHAHADAEPLVRICDDAAEWPPYSYYLREQGQKTDRLSGYSVDVITRILNKHSIPFQIVLLPWKRCLAYLEQGDKYLMALSASKNPERETLYLFSTPYYKTHYYLFYSKARNPTGMNVSSQADLNHYRLGGIHGYAYTALGEVDKTRMIRTAGYLELVKMLHAGRVDLFAEDYEVVVGMTAIGAYDFLGDPRLGMVPLAGVADNQFHMIFTRKNPRGQALQRLVNTELQAMQDSGELTRLLEAYVPP